ncbi:MAG: hydrolase 1, exosortase A system-associated [Pseudomonadota bacterium]
MIARRPVSFACGKTQLAGSLDAAPGRCGLLVVSGGNEIRSGAFSGQARLAAEVAQAGFPVFRFDRRGIGDSDGENAGFRSSSEDITAALLAFREHAPQLDRIIGFGNCDAASALMLSQGSGLDGLVLSNPWTIEPAMNEAQATETVPPPSAIRARYLAKLTNPSEVARLLRGGVDLGKLMRGLIKSVEAEPAPSKLVEQMRAGLTQFTGPVLIVLGTSDRTAQLFLSQWDKGDPRIAKCEGAGHAYVEPEHQIWLKGQILSILRS